MTIQQVKLKVEIAFDVKLSQTLYGWEAWSSSLGSTHAKTKEERLRILKESCEKFK